MMQKKACVRQVALWVAAATMIFAAAGADASTVASNARIQQRPDVIRINDMKVFGPLERAPVEFLHDKHTEALKKLGKSCSACHLQDKATGHMSIKYMRLKDTSKKAVMNIYHKGCITCHSKLLAEGKPSGPVECAGCHRKVVTTVSDRLPIGMDHSLHYIHTQALDNKCATCHHVYDKTTKKLVYVKGKECTCRYCHREKTEGNRISMREAAHIACVGCHERRLAEKKAAGPVECAGCHSAAGQAKIKKVANVPRMKMNQPDAVFVATQPANAKTTETARMNLVPFDHKAHETYTHTCRVCHHAALTKCAACHTLRGEKEGGWVNLEEAMHRSTAGQSCVGCHRKQQEQKACAGCHGLMTQSDQQSQATCKVCHSVPRPEKATPVSAEASAEAARAALSARKPTIGTYNLADIPETVTIKVLSNTYQPVTLPHRKIVEALLKGIQGNKLAEYFHTQPGTICQGCHHHSPASLKPPRCESCHGKAFQEATPYRPGLRAAFHQECMGCHEAMGIKKPASRNCVACHKKK